MKSEPDERGMFGPFGGRFVPEMLISALDELVEESAKILADPGYRKELDDLLRDVDVGLIPVLWEDNLPQVAIEMQETLQKLVDAKHGVRAAKP